MKGKSLNNSLRVLRLLGELKQKRETGFTLHAREVFLSQSATSALSRKKLTSILGADRQHPKKRNTSLRRFYILPRRGTRSPWSSKTGDILKDVLPSDSRPTHIEKGVIYAANIPPSLLSLVRQELCDKMTQEILEEKELPSYFAESRQRSELLFAEAREMRILKKMNLERGWALDESELTYINCLYKRINRKATEAELAVFAQLNSEHCRHKVFNASLITEKKERLTGTLCK